MVSGAKLDAIMPTGRFFYSSEHPLDGGLPAMLRSTPSFAISLELGITDGSVEETRRILLSVCEFA